MEMGLTRILVRQNVMYIKEKLAIWFYSVRDGLILQIYKLYYKYILYIHSVHDIRLKTTLLYI